ncbi:MAG: hypothetical protein ACFFCW_27710 [Candidatus Hodarchaeota archaeon]
MWSKDQCCSQKPKDLFSRGSPIVSSLSLKAWGHILTPLWGSAVFSFLLRGHALLQQLVRSSAPAIQLQRGFLDA